MNNEHKGEVSFEVGDETFVLRRSWNSICELEGLTGQGFFALSQELSSWGPPAGVEETPEAMAARIGRIKGTTLRAVLCSMLRDERPGISLSEAGDLIDALGIEKVLELVGQAFERGNPKSRAAAETKGSRPTTTNGQAAST